MALDRQRTEPQTTGSTLSTGLTTVAAITAILVFLQAILAGRGLFGDPDLFDVHEIVANFVLLSALIQAVLAFIAMRRGLASRALFGISLVIVVLVIVQIGLGYSVTDSNTAGTLHVPNGVLLFGLSIVAAMQARGR